MDSPEILSPSFKPQLPLELKPKTPDVVINLDILPSEMIEQILLKADLREIFNFCQTSNIANQYCQSEIFWKKKYQRDYSDFTPLEKGVSWKKRYQHKSILAAQLQFGNISISAGFNHWGFIDSLSIYTIGDDDYGQRGHIDSFSRNVPFLPRLDVRQLNSAMKYDIFHIDDEITSEIRLGSKVISLSCGEDFTGIITADGVAYLWGSLHDMLHWSHIQPGNTKTDIFSISITNSQRATKIVTGKRGYAIFMDDGKIYIRNSNNGYHILPAFKNRIIDITIIDIVTDDIYILDQTGQVGMFTGNNDIIPVNFPEPIKQLSSGENFWVALSKSGNVYTWGNNDDWQLGFEPVNHPTIKIIALGMSKMWEYFGYWAKHPIYKLDLPDKITFISAGYYTTAAVAKNGKLYMWGVNNGGNIDIKNQGKFLPTEVNLKAPVKYVSVGGSFTVAMSMDGEIIYWGDPEMNPAGNES